MSPFAFWQRSAGVSLALLLLAGAAAAAQAPAPLPPKRPAGPATMAPPPLPRPLPPRAAWARPAPLPPARPAELDALRAEDEEAEESQAQERVAPEVGAKVAALPAQRAPAFAPLPPRRAAPEATPAPEAPAEGEEAPADVITAPVALAPACAELVAEGAMLATLEKDIPPNGSCGLPQPVRLSGVRLADGRMVALRPAAIVACEVAAAFTAWMREDVGPAVAALGSELSAVQIAASYDCRPRNRVAGARMSEHGLGKAVDVGGFELADRRLIKVEKGGLPRLLRVGMKDSACRRFATVLGPGSDGYHEDHVHVDLAVRKRDYKLCRWDLDAGAVVARKKEAAPAAGAKPAGAKGEKAGDEAAPAAAPAPVAEAQPSGPAKPAAR
ncbi:extensin family protein [Xanthobacter dioxanivorans]|uniref:Extensin family protein n=1 Tax=Xanthobacter dioxanivorans TaxID=2528964 RepID=A0A974PSE8_9HYPH|nr:extensin family protein [Xanthobacter dioxanivorans]QRG08509.1 extensin family protein [Xanthobacter dioxanivorans]